MPKMATRWKNKRRKSLYNKEDSSNNFIYRLSSSPPAPVPSPPTLEPPVLSSPTLEPPVPSLSQEAPTLSPLSVPPSVPPPPDPVVLSPPPPLAPPTPFRVTNDPSSQFKSYIEGFTEPLVFSLPEPVVPSPPPLAPPTPFRVTNDPSRSTQTVGKKKRKKRKAKEALLIEDKKNIVEVYLDVNKICRMEIDKLDEIQNEVLVEMDQDCILHANEEMEQSRFNKEAEERRNDSIRKRMDDIKIHLKRKKEALFYTQDTLTPRTIVQKLSSHASKVINTPF